MVEANLPAFIEGDPVQIPRQFSKKEDIEIVGFLTATIAWGQRKTIMNNANKLVDLMDGDPHNFILNHKSRDLKAFENFVHRTFNATDLLYFIHKLKHIYCQHIDLENYIFKDVAADNLAKVLSTFKQNFFNGEHPYRSQKHIANPEKGSTAKRLLMFMRWMCRKNLADIGIWSKIKPAQLLPPIDVHSAYYARAMGLLTRKQNDWKAVNELGENLRLIDPNDPVKYDYVLYGMGAFPFFRPLSDLRL